MAGPFWFDPRLLGTVPSGAFPQPASGGMFGGMQGWEPGEYPLAFASARPTQADYATSPPFPPEPTPARAQPTAGRTAMPNGVLSNNLGGGNGLLPFANNPIDQNRNAILGYLAGALQGGNLGQSIGRGLEGFATGGGLDRERAGEAALGEFVGSAGLPEPLARAASLNPGLAKTLTTAMAGTMFAKPTFGKIGQDAMGRETYGFIDPIRQKVTPLDAPGASAAGFENPQGLAGEDYLNTLPTGIANTVRSILEGRMQPPTSFAASKPYWQGILQHAANAEPGFDLTKWSGRVGTAKDFASGTASKNVTSLNTVIGHLDTLRESADKLNNTSIPYWNAAANLFQSNLGKPEVKNFEIARNAVADEMAKVFRSSGMSDTEIKSWKDTLGTSNSPEQFKAVIGQGVELMNSRLDALKDQYRRGAGKEPPELLSPKAQKTLENVNAWVRGSALAKPGTTQETESGWQTLPGGIKIRQK